MPPDDVARAHALRCALLAKGAESLAAEAQELGPLENAPTAEEYRAQAVSLRRRYVLATVTARPKRRTPASLRLPQRSPRSRRRRVTSGPRKARAPDDSEPSGDGGEPEPSSGCPPSPQPVDFLDAVALSLGWVRA
jgi:hypothetical protein